MTPHGPTRALRARPDLAQLKRQAKELLDAVHRGDAEALAEVRTHDRRADLGTFALHDAQLVLARAYGFASWPRLKAHVDGITVGRLIEAIQAGDLDAVRRMVTARPEIVRLDTAENDERQALHHAVLARQPEITRLLMRHGAEPYTGVYPHRDATRPLTLAIERGYTDIVAIIQDEGGRRDSLAYKLSGAAGVAEMNVAFGRGDQSAMIALLDRYPGLARVSDPQGRTILHKAAAYLWDDFIVSLLERGADATARAADGTTVIDMLGRESDVAADEREGLFSRVTEQLFSRGATQSAHWAVAAGDAAWLRARHAKGALSGTCGLLSHAVIWNRPEIVAVLLELGLDPDERGTLEGLEETVPTWGSPLRECAIRNSIEAARILLAHGANANTLVYAASSALYEAHKRRHTEILGLLERHGGQLQPVAVAELGMVDRAAALLAEPADTPRPEGFIGPGTSIASELIWGAMGHPSPAIVRLALPHLDWPRDDRRWHRLLVNGLYLGPDSDRGGHLETFRMVLARAHPDVPGSWSGTLLHDVVASRGGLNADDRTTYATVLLDAGARMDVRDDLLLSTPLGWACRWGRTELVRLFLDRGADPVESGAESWATPRAWADKMGHADIGMMLSEAGA